MKFKIWPMCHTVKETKKVTQEIIVEMHDTIVKLKMYSKIMYFVQCGRLVKGSSEKKVGD